MSLDVSPVNNSDSDSESHQTYHFTSLGRNDQGFRGEMTRFRFRGETTRGETARASGRGAGDSLGAKRLAPVSCVPSVFSLSTSPATNVFIYKCDKDSESNQGSKTTLST